MLYMLQLYTGQEMLDSYWVHGLNEASVQLAVRTALWQCMTLTPGASAESTGLTSESQELFCRLFSHALYEHEA